MENTQEFICIEHGCGKTYTMTESAVRYFTDRDLFIPKRCPDCRRKRKEEREAAEENNN